MPDPVDRPDAAKDTVSTLAAAAPPVPALGFRCSICREPSGEICVWCTKDACALHLCESCHRCSDCCLCRQHDQRR